MDHDITPQLRSWLHDTIGTIPDPVHLYPAVAADAQSAPRKRGWLPRMLPTGTSVPMFSVSKFVVAAAIVALFAGFLLAGALTQPSEQAAPAATTDGPGTFRPAGSLPEPRSGHTATLLRDGRVLVVGGVHVADDPSGPGRQTVADAVTWDPETASFSPAGSLAEPRTAHTATLLADGRVLVVGGYDFDFCDGYCFHQIDGAEVWDPETASFSPAASLARAREWHAAIGLLDGRVLIVGGYNGDGSGLPKVAEVWDPKTETFSPAGSLDVTRTRPVATLLLDGRVLVVGGDGTGGRRASAEIWDPMISSFASAGSIDHRHDDIPLTGFSTTHLPDGDFLIVGGEYDVDPSEYRDVFRYVATAVLWDPDTGEPRPAGELARERAHHTATLLPDGRVLVVAGGASSNHWEIASAELWDPKTASFTPAGSLLERRWGHSTTLLDDGRVFVLGGIDPSGKRLASAEVWEPGARQPAMDDEDTAPDLLPSVGFITEEVEAATATE